MKYERGDVVLVDYPFADQTGSKVRPALVVQADTWNVRLDYTILAMITSSPRRRLAVPTQLFIEINSPEATGTGLRADSVIQCENLVTYKQSKILKHLGRLTALSMDQIDDCLRSTLALKS